MHKFLVILFVTWKYIVEFWYKYPTIVFTWDDFNQSEKMLSWLCNLISCNNTTKLFVWKVTTRAATNQKNEYETQRRAHDTIGRSQGPGHRYAKQTQKRNHATKCVICVSVKKHEKSMNVNVCAAVKFMFEEMSKKTFRGRKRAIRNIKKTFF